MAVNTVFDNKVIESVAKDLLTTAINTRSLMTIDNELAESAGMVKTINTYTYTGEAEELANGVGNTASKRGTISYVGNDYRVKLCQQAYDYTDEEAMKDPYIVDAISTLNLEDESQLFILIPNKWKAALRKDADYKSAMMGQVIYNGQVGTICGIPVIATKAFTDKAFVMTKEAVKLFIKKDVEVEPDRNPDTRKNSVYLRATYLVALADATKICKISEANA